MRSGADSDGGSETDPSQKMDKDSEAYRLKRDRNNLAVKKSREKTRQKTSETTERMKALREENEQLEHKVDSLSKELGTIKELLLAHARGNVSKTESVSPTTAATTTATTHSRPNVGAGTSARVNRPEEEETPNVNLVRMDHEYFAPTRKQLKREK